MTTPLTLRAPPTPAMHSPAAASLVESILTEPRLPAKVTRQPPARIDTLLTKDEFVRLVAHMANDNPISHFWLLGLMMRGTRDTPEQVHIEELTFTRDGRMTRSRAKRSVRLRWACIQKTKPMSPPGVRSTSTHMTAARMSLRKIGQSGRLR